MGRAFVRVSYSVLEKLLHLPTGIKIFGGRDADAINDSYGGQFIDLGIEGEQLEAVFAHDIKPRVTFEYVERPADTVARELVGKWMGDCPGVVVRFEESERLQQLIAEALLAKPKLEIKQ